MTILQLTRSKSKYMVGTLEELNRIGSDEFGNPKYEIVIRLDDDSTWRGITQTSANFVYGLSGRIFGKRVQLCVRGAMTITGCTEV